MKQQFWQCKLTAFDAELCKMVESLTGKPCDLCRTDFVPIYKKLGRDKFLEFLKANPDINNPKAARERLKVWQQI